MKFFQSSSCEIVAGNQLGIMFIRGFAGLGLMAWSFNVMVTMPLLGFLMLGIAILLLKGCPACWGMHMINILRNSTKAKKTKTGALPETEQMSAKRQYQTRDMAAHLFPPEDVARFRIERQAAENSTCFKK
jgi:hypothetical protein